MFAYDSQASLDTEDLSPPQDRDGVTVRDIAYASPKGGKVTAYFQRSGPLGPHRVVGQAAFVVALDGVSHSTAVTGSREGP